MKRLLFFIYATLLFGPVLYAQESTPARLLLSRKFPGRSRAHRDRPRLDKQ